ncbi:MAG: PEP-CTERM sorting domain-containing protein [Opitutaceae bacterium]|jgi:probable HAF family extracellular repeat protein
MGSIFLTNAIRFIADMKTSTQSQIRALRGIFFVIALSTAPSLLHGQSYTAVELGSFGGDTYASAINDAGTVVGGSFTSSGNERAFSYSDGNMTDLGSLGGTNSFATGINNTGTVVGYSDFSTNVLSGRAFSYSAGTMADLGTLGGTYGRATAVNNTGTIVGFSSQTPSDIYPFAFSSSHGQMTNLGALGTESRAYGINDAGTVVGFSWIGDIYRQACSYRNGTITNLGTLTFNSNATAPFWDATSEAYGINNAGTIVGQSATTIGSALFEHAFSDSNGIMIDLGTLGGSTSSAEAINDNGLIVGFATTTSGAQDAFVYSGGSMIDLNSLVSLNGVTLTDAMAINDVGQIVAEGSNDQSYLLTFIPEPSTYATILGAVTLGFSAIRKKRRLI